MTADLENVISEQPTNQLISDGFLSGPYRLALWRAKPIADSIGEIISIVMGMCEAPPRLMLGENFHKGTHTCT